MRNPGLCVFLQVQALLNQSQLAVAAPKNPQQHPKAEALCKVCQCEISVTISGHSLLGTRARQRNINIIVVVISCSMRHILICTNLLSHHSSAFQASSQRPSRTKAATSYTEEVNRSLTHTFFNLIVICRFQLWFHLQVTIDDSDEDFPMMKATRPPPRCVCFCDCFLYFLEEEIPIVFLLYIKYSAAILFFIFMSFSHPPQTFVIILIPP